jgi:methionyl-tRNA formyltransferase
MRLVNKMDAGPVYAQCTISVPRQISKQELSDALLLSGVTLFNSYFSSIINNEIIPILQDESRATYDKLIKKSDGKIDWNKSAEQIERELRAYAKWPRSFTKFGAYDVIITRAEVINETGVPGTIKVRKGDLICYANKGALSVSRLQPFNKKEMSVTSFLAGYKL